LEDRWGSSSWQLTVGNRQMFIKRALWWGPRTICGGLAVMHNVCAQLVDSPRRGFARRPSLLQAKKRVNIFLLLIESIYASAHLHILTFAHPSIILLLFLFQNNKSAAFWGRKLGVFAFYIFPYHFVQNQIGYGVFFSKVE
jgi:hypothetical protein